MAVTVPLVGEKLAFQPEVICWPAGSSKLSLVFVERKASDIRGEAAPTMYFPEVPALYITPTVRLTMTIGRLGIGIALVSTAPAALGELA